jgi:hypothetical protein
MLHLDEREDEDGRPGGRKENGKGRVEQIAVSRAVISVWHQILAELKGEERATRLK